MSDVELQELEQEKLTDVGALLAERSRLLAEVRRLRQENKQFRCSVRQYAEYHAMLKREGDS